MTLLLAYSLNAWGICMRRIYTLLCWVGQEWLFMPFFPSNFWRRMSSSTLCAQIRLWEFILSIENPCVDVINCLCVLSQRLEDMLYPSSIFHIRLLMQSAWHVSVISSARVVHIQVSCMSTQDRVCLLYELFQGASLDDLSLRTGQRHICPPAVIVWMLLLPLCLRRVLNLYDTWIVPGVLFISDRVPWCTHAHMLLPLCPDVGKTIYI